MYFGLIFGLITFLKGPDLSTSVSNQIINFKFNNLPG